MKTRKVLKRNWAHWLVLLTFGLIPFYPAANELWAIQRQLAESRPSTAELSDQLDKRLRTWVSPGRPADSVSKALRLLEVDGSPEAVTALSRCLRGEQHQAVYRRYALQALGRIGTREAIEAIEQFEAFASTRDPLTSADVARPNGWCGTGAVYPRETLVQLGQTAGRGPMGISIFANRFVGGHDELELWYSKSPYEQRKVRPQFLGTVEFSEIEYQNAHLDSLVRGDNMLENWEWTLSESGTLRLRDTLDDRVLLESQLPVSDRDSDGLPDSLERLLGTDPNSRDTDSDGIEDEIDHNPTLARTIIAKSREQAIRQAVFMYVYGTDTHPYAIWVADRPDEPAHEYYGHQSYVLRDATGVPSHDPNNGYYRREVVDIEVTKSDAKRATAYFRNGTGSLYWLILNQVDGKWLVVNGRMHIPRLHDTPVTRSDQVWSSTSPNQDPLESVVIRRKRMRSSPETQAATPGSR